MRARLVTRLGALLFASLLVCWPASVRAQAIDPDPALYLDAVFTYGIGGQSALGGEAHGTASWTLARGDVDLAADLGVRLGYEAEPSALAPWVDGRDAWSLAHRVRMHVTLGPTLRFGGLARELSLGLHVYAGPTYWESDASASFARYGVSGSSQVSTAVFDAGAFLRFTWRPHPVAGLAIVAGAPFWGVASSYLVDLFHVGLGVAFRLD